MERGIIRCPSLPSTRAAYVRVGGGVRVIHVAMNVVLVLAALVAILDYFGLRPKESWWGLVMPLNKNWKLFFMLGLVAAALGMSGYDFYRTLRPKIVEKVVEKITEKPVPTPCPEPPKASKPAKPRVGSRPKVELPPNPSQQQSGKDNTQTGPIDQGPCSNLQIGGANNQATTRCGQTSVIKTYNFDGSQTKVISGGTNNAYLADPNPTIVLIRQQLGSGQSLEALTNAEQLMITDPYWAAPHVLAGIAYVNLGKLDAAKVELRKARELVPSGYEFENDYASHLQHLEEVIKRHEH